MPSLISLAGLSMPLKGSCPVSLFRGPYLSIPREFLGRMVVLKKYISHVPVGGGAGRGVGWVLEEVGPGLALAGRCGPWRCGSWCCMYTIGRSMRKRTL